MNALPRVLVIEDDRAIRSLIVASLRREKLEMDVASDGAEALTLTEQSRYAIVILDLLMPRMNGFEFLDAFHRSSPDADTLVIVVSAFDDGMLRKLQSYQVHAVVRKPFDVPFLMSVVHDLAVAWTDREAPKAMPAELVAPAAARSLRT